MFNDLRPAFGQLVDASLVKLGWLGFKESGQVVTEVVIVFVATVSKVVLERPEQVVI